jgi:hypothetical protein
MMSEIVSPDRTGVAIPRQIVHEGEIEHAVQVAVEVVGRDELLKRHQRERSEQLRFRAHHGRPLSSWGAQESQSAPCELPMQWRLCQLERR